MKFRAKWTAVTFFALTALGAASVAFAGCTVTSGKVNDVEGGTITPTGDSSTGDSSTGDSSTGSNTCEGNDKQTYKPLISAACQNDLNAECCTELKSCFNATATTTMDCNVYGACLADCAKPESDGAVPTPAEIDKCQTDFCDANASKAIQDGWQSISDCAKVGNKSHLSCAGLF